METAAFKEHVQKSWHAVGARDNQDIPMSYCWVLPDGWHLFQAFPEVLCVYGTHETNNKHRPLLSLSLKDSDGKYVMVVVRCLMKILVVPFAMWRSPFCAFRDSNTVIDEACNDWRRLTRNGTGWLCHCTTFGQHTSSLLPVAAPCSSRLETRSKRFGLLERE